MKECSNGSHMEANSLFKQALCCWDERGRKEMKDCSSGREGRGTATVNVDHFPGPSPTLLKGIKCSC